MDILRKVILFKMVTIILSLGTHVSAHSQPANYIWTKNITGPRVENAEAIAIDGLGNTYITGSFEMTATLDNKTAVSRGFEDIFIAKYDPAGNVLWVKSAGGTSRDESYDIAVDSVGNCYIIGNYTDRAVFEGTTLISSSPTAAVPFIAKYDTNGNVIWVIDAPTSNTAFGKAIALDLAGNIYAVGDFAGNVTIGSTMLTGNGTSDIFIAKFDHSGTAVWAKKGVSASDADGRAITVDASGNCYVSGSFQSSIVFESTTLTGGQWHDTYLVKYDTNGNLVRAQEIRSTGSVFGDNLVVDATGLYISGSFNGVATFGAATLTWSGTSDLFVAKMDSSGNFIWATKAGGTWVDRCWGMAVDLSGNIYITGSFDDICTFGSITLTANSPSGEIYIAKLNSTGNFQWVLSSNSIDFAAGRDIAIDALGNCYVSGAYAGGISIGNTTFSHPGMSHSIVFKLGPFLDVPQPLDLDLSLQAFPNPFVSEFVIDLPETKSLPVVVALTDMLGREVHRQVIQPKDAQSSYSISPDPVLSPGLFVLQIHQGSSVRQIRVCKQ